MRQFPAGERGLPAPTRSRWWIPTAVRVLALLSKSFCFILNIVFENKMLIDRMLTAKLSCSSGEWKSIMSHDLETRIEIAFSDMKRINEG